jgi:acetyl-CoA carboxylase carboxyl transferase subunit beta
VNWLKRAKQGIKTWRKREVPDGLWEKCPSCGEILYKKEIARLMSVCPKCAYHFRIGAKDYIEIITDAGTFTEIYKDLISSDPLDFRDSMKYRDRVKNAQRRTGLNSAVITGTAALSGRHVAMALMAYNRCHLRWGPHAGIDSITHADGENLRGDRHAF